MRVALPYGARPYDLDLGARPFEVLDAAALPEPLPVETLLAQALDRPIGSPGAAQLRASASARVTLIVSDATRAEPRAAFIEAIRARLHGVRWTLAVATGTHGPAPLSELDLPPDFVRDATIVNHDGHRDDDLVDLGETARGTPVRIHRCVVDADLVVATGCIRPHYFAGFGAGAKALFPGLGQAAAIRKNHRLKTEAASRAGIVDGNPCRDDLEEAVARVVAPVFLLDGVVGPDERIHAAVAGDLGAAFRAGVELARPWFTVRARPSSLVIASAALPVSASLYQAAKIAAASAPLVAVGGTLVVAAQCPEGIGPLETVNEAIFRIGVLPRLPAGARLVLVSDLSEAATRTTLLEYAPSIEDELARSSVSERALVLPHASHLLAEASS